MIPYPGQAVSPFDTITAQFTNETIANIEALAAGTGFDDNISADSVAGITDADSGSIYGITVTNGKLPGSAISLASGEGSLKSKIIQFTRDGTAASGDVSYTGVGFIPSSIHFLMNVDNTLFRSDGVTDSSLTSWAIYQSAASKWYSQVSAIIYSDQASWAQSAIVKSFNADGFTLTWNKIGTVPAGTMKIIAICYR